MPHRALIIIFWLVPEPIKHWKLIALLARFHIFLPPLSLLPPVSLHQWSLYLQYKQLILFAFMTWCKFIIIPETLSLYSFSSISLLVSKGLLILLKVFGWLLKLFDGLGFLSFWEGSWSINKGRRSCKSKAEVFIWCILVNKEGSGWNGAQRYGRFSEMVCIRRICQLVSYNRITTHWTAHWNCYIGIGKSVGEGSNSISYIVCKTTFL